MTAWVGMVVLFSFFFFCPRWFFVQREYRSHFFLLAVLYIYLLSYKKAPYTHLTITITILNKGIFFFNFVTKIEINKNVLECGKKIKSKDSNIGSYALKNFYHSYTYIIVILKLAYKFILLLSKFS